MGRNKPNFPLKDLEHHIRKSWDREFNDIEILACLEEDKLFDTEKYGLAIKKLRKYRKELRLIHARTANFQVEDIINNMIYLRKKYPHAGYPHVKKLLRKRSKEVTKHVIIEYMHKYKPDLVRARVRQRLRCRRFWAAGVNDVWCVDQHDKLKHYGLALHTGVDPFTEKIKWMRVWWTNSNPRLIFRYYLDCIKKDIWFDPGPENFCLAKGHSFIRQSLDSGLEGTLQHRCMNEKNNMLPEITWLNIRCNFTPGMEDILSNLDFPWFQAELDVYVDLINTTKRRAQTHKILLHGPPDDIDENAHGP
ncbi:hypothetical protein K435DRAFT_916160 [Dendrothele bispora CBS 962.96]|uniref:Uncharacterized protein n=1 Tax=Dendrothele bispora (strain CBS 962.96) TaxID=1314807 RepID=A0A4S8MLN6_DENBC|nr:hypothetical protein K435DRAFT_916160 [Dendrothele bispora CBS 962.96]